MTQPAGSKAISGSQILVFVNGSAWGNAKSIRLRTVTNNKRLFGLDASFPFDMIPTNIVVNGTLECYALEGDGAEVGQEGERVWGEYVMEIYIRSIPMEKIVERYGVESPGDYWRTGKDSVAIRSVQTGNPDYDYLIALHEMIEEWDCTKRGCQSSAPRHCGD